MSDEIGETYEQHLKNKIEWHVSDFMPLLRRSELEGETVRYKSPNFLYADSCWCFEIYCDTDKMSKDWVVLFLCRMDRGLPKTFRFSLSIRTAGGKEERLWNGENTFNEWSSCDSKKMISMSEFLNRKADTIPDGILTFICSFESQSQQLSEGSLFNRLLKLSLSLKDILFQRKRTDVVLKLKDGEIPAHRMILESRSRVFKGMFNVDMTEAGTEEVTIEDRNEETFNVVLSYVYSGDPEGLCAKNACEVYETAHKYELEELKQLCVDCMQEYLSVDTVWNVITFAEMHKETKLQECAKNFFAENVIEVFKTQEWVEVKRKDPKLTTEVLEYVCKRLF